jgi:two-component system nitrate/nitrite response regulator NarL
MIGRRARRRQRSPAGGHDGQMALSRHVLVVDDHPILRRGLLALLEPLPWVASITEASTVADALAAFRQGPVDLVAMDVGLPDGDGVEATRRLLSAHPRLAVLIISLSGDDEVVARALSAGARGYVLKDAAPHVVVDALRTVAEGGVVLGPGINPGALRSPGSGGHPAVQKLPPPFDALTPRELQILSGIAAGKTNERIAREVGVTPKTIRNQVSTVMAKLGVSGRVQAALLARDAGVVPRPQAR